MPNFTGRYSVRQLPDNILLQFRIMSILGNMVPLASTRKQTFLKRQTGVPEHKHIRRPHVNLNILSVNANKYDADYSQYNI